MITITRTEIQIITGCGVPIDRHVAAYTGRVLYRIKVTGGPF